MTTRSFQLLVIGGGSGGLGCARRAAQHGASVAVVERGKLGGTCVNVGCVPKKIMFNCASMAEHLEESRWMGFPSSKSGDFDWNTVKKNRDAYIQRLNGIYEANLQKDGVTLIRGSAHFTGPNSIEVNGETYEGEQIVIACGGKPRPPPPNMTGGEHVIFSDQFFELEQCPKKVVVVGAGYIAVELAGVLSLLGADAHLCIRHDEALRRFDSFIREDMMKSLDKMLNVHRQFTPKLVEKSSDNTFTVTSEDGSSISGAEKVIYAIGRVPVADELNLESAGVKLNSRGYISSDKYETTLDQSHIFSIGDVNGKLELTPVAIAAGRKLADRLYGGKTDSYLEYDNVPTVVFNHPPIATIGLTEDGAVKEYGQDKVKVYKSRFTSMTFALQQVPSEEKPKTSLKVVCVGDDERVVGIHMIGDACDEIMQGFGVAVKMGATKKDLDSVVAIHPDRKSVV